MLSDEEVLSERNCEFLWQPPISLHLLPEETREEAALLFAKVKEFHVPLVDAELEKRIASMRANRGVSEEEAAVLQPLWLRSELVSIVDHVLRACPQPS